MRKIRYSRFYPALLKVGYLEYTALKRLAHYSTSLLLKYKKPLVFPYK